MQKEEFQEVPRPGSVWSDGRDRVTVKSAVWNRVEFWRGEALCVLPGRLFHRRFKKIASPAVPSASLDHPVIQRFLNLRGRQTTNGQQSV